MPWSEVIKMSTIIVVRPGLRPLGRLAFAFMDRTDALAIVKKRSSKDTTLRHLITVEGIMRRLAGHFGEDVDLWGLAGLFHDLDMELTHDDLSRHAYLAAEWLTQDGVDPRIINAVLAHAHEQYRTDRMSQAIVQADAVAGFLVACALVRPEKAVGMKVSSAKKKLKERSFAPGVEREEILGVEEKLGIPLDEFIQLGIEGIQSVAEEVGLVP